MERQMRWFPGTSEQSYDPMLLLRMKVDTANKTPGSLTDYDCSACLNRGYIADLNREGNMICRPCKCMEIRRCVANMKRSGMEKLMEKRFENFRTEQPWQEKLLSTCREFLREEDSWLSLCGQSGSGKTHLCSALCRELLLQGKTVRYMLWQEASARLRDLDLDAEKRHSEKEGYKTAPVLYIDDLLKPCGDGKPTSGELRLAFEILNHRYVQNLTTLISTELSPDTLMCLDQALGGRIKEKCGKYLLCITPDKGKNMRMGMP